MRKNKPVSPPKPKNPNNVAGAVKRGTKAVIDGTKPIVSGNNAAGAVSRGARAIAPKNRAIDAVKRVIRKTR